MKKPEAFLTEKKTALEKVKKLVADAYSSTLGALKAKGLPESTAMKIAYGAAVKTGKLGSIEMNLDFPDTLFDDAKRATYGNLIEKYPNEDVAGFVVGKKKHKKHKKSKK